MVVAVDGERRSLFFVDFDWKHANELIKVLQRSGAEVPADLREIGQRAERRAAKHSEESGLTTDALYRLRHGGQSNADEDDDEIERRIFGDDANVDDGVRTVVQKGKSQQTTHGRHHAVKPGGKKPLIKSKYNNVVKAPNLKTN